MTFGELERIYILQLKVKRREREFEYKQSVYSDRELERECRLLGNIQSALYRELRKLGMFINGIEYPVIRDIVRLRYCKGYNWQQVSDSIEDGTAEGCQKALRKYLRLKQLQHNRGTNESIHKNGGTSDENIF